MTQATANNNQSVYCELTPAVPTDTCAVINHLLTLAECARKELDVNGPTLIPRGVVAMLLRAMKVRDPGIIRHGQRIGVISRGVAQLLGWEDAPRAELELAALLHDLGKIGVPDHILHKPGKLSSEEYDVVSLYHQAATSLLQSLSVDTGLVSVLRMLHYNYDGAGVEAEGAGIPKDLPLGPRILAVADAYDSLSSPKSYRRGMTHDEAIKVLTDQSGSRYDGNVVRTLSRWHEAEGGQLFALSDPFGEQQVSAEMSSDERNEIMVLTQILNILYQFDTLYDGYFIVDANLSYCIWSDGMQELCGKSPEHVMGRSWLSSDVKLSPITQTKGTADTEEEIVSQVRRNGRPQFGSRVCDTEDGPSRQCRRLYDSG